MGQTSENNAVSSDAETARSSNVPDSPLERTEDRESPLIRLRPAGQGKTVSIINRGCASHKKDSVNLKSYTVRQVAEHDKENDCWIIINNKVYDVTNFSEKHPGGQELMLKCGGRDVTEIFHQYHPTAVRSRIGAFCVGYVADYEADEDIRAIAKLGDDLENEGYFVSRLSFTAKTLTWCLSLLAIAVGLILAGRRYNSPMIQLAAAFFLAAHLQQTAFLGHDTGHCAVTGNRFADCMFGIFVGNFLTGLSIGWWKDSHNTHHILTNVVQHDPDIQHLPALAITNKFFGSLWSYYFHRTMRFDRLAQSLVSYQHICFYPVMMVARWNLYAQSVYRILFTPGVEYRRFEMIATVLYCAWLYYLLSFCLSFTTGLGVLMFSHALAGLLHVQIVLSHLSCETLDEVPYTNDSVQWLDVQLRTSLDVDCAPWMDWFHGGLQFQVAHHLFPRMPRHNLRACSERVKDLCKKLNKNYQHATFARANIMMISNLKDVAMEARQGRFIEKGGKMMWDGFCANG